MRPINPYPEILVDEDREIPDQRHKDFEAGIDAVFKMFSKVDLKELEFRIQHWEILLLHNKFILGPTIIYHVEKTIEYLNELKKLRGV